jgi:hypothetical protein
LTADFSFRAIWNKKLQEFGPIAFLTVVVSLCSCDANLFGPESRVIARGYRLKRVDNSNQFALTIPYEDGGLIIDEIGWHEPPIFARAFGSQYWDVINTAHAQHIRVSDLQRKSDPISQSIQIRPAGTADRKRAFLSGFQMHIAKPVEPSELIAMVASLAGRTRYIRELD